nr:DUF1998 domain-containing protein [Baekduia sp.]
VAIAARFLLACRRGHHDDFPWAEFVHRGNECPGKRWELELRELGMGAEAAKVEVRCRTCDSARRMSEAFGTAAEDNLPACRGYHPHLGSVEEGCEEPARTILLGASNSWFPITLSVVAIPTEQDALAQLVADAWSDLQDVDSEATLKFALPRLPELAELRGHPVDAIWAAIEAQRAGDSGDEGSLDLRIAEWEVLSDPSGVPPTEDFRTRMVPVPREHVDLIAEVVLCERLREVVALTGFTRVESPDDLDVAGDNTPTAPISRAAPTWVPCVEVRGEGVFVRFDDEKVAAWEREYRKSPSATRLLEGHRLWRARRNLDPANGFPGWRYLLLHTFSHALLRELALECGYSASSIRERIYATRPDGEGPDMAGASGGCLTRPSTTRCSAPATRCAVSTIRVRTGAFTSRHVTPASSLPRHPASEGIATWIVPRSGRRSLSRTVGSSVGRRERRRVAAGGRRVRATSAGEPRAAAC